MKELCFDSVRFIPGQNQGKYPYCHSVYIEGDGVLIDPSSDRERLINLKENSGVKQVWLSHWHEDHIMHLDLFDDIPFLISNLDAPQLSDLDIFMDGYGFNDQDIREFWRTMLIDQFHFKPRKPDRFFKDKELIQLDTVTVEVIHTPGHTPGHYSFFFKEPKVLFMGDYDLTPFGPWYGDRESSLQDTITSIERLRHIPAKIWITSHEKGLFEKEPGDVWNQYLNVIKTREDKLLNLLQTPKTMDDIIDAYIVYGKPREPKEFFLIGERGIMGKHIEDLLERSIIKKESGRFFV
ncbi:MAG: MBL fold metallo-hydrolase [Deltaproteobacteria bacterium]|nr:MBL fold metallo-hydrolase [Deltaproteobacteria bacterium]MBW2180942.1 MBL fold metallo-hydrolase [Deltaproteobacteria bacterium]